MDVESCLEAAAAALVPVFGAVELVGAERLPGRVANVVVRATVREASGREHRVVVKAGRPADLGMARELAALRVLSEHKLPGVVSVLAAATDPPVVVLRDLGPGRTLASRLLGSDPERAEAALRGWALALGTLQAQTLGLREAFASELARVSGLDAPKLDRMVDETTEAARTLTARLPDLLGVVPAPGAVEELTHLARELVVGPGEGNGALVPGDTCPDNAIETDSGYVLIDYEAADYRHVVWDAAYLTVPWPSCWCSWRLPDGTVTQALEAWRSALAPALNIAQAARLDDDLQAATIVWALIQVAWVLEPAVRDERVGRARQRERDVVPSARALVQHRLLQLTGLLDGRLPGLETLAGELGKVARRRWGECPLLVAPAFR